MIAPKRLDDGPACPRCECPEVPTIRFYDQVLTRRGGKREQVVRRQRQCQNQHCAAVFWTVERHPLN